MNPKTLINTLRYIILPATLNSYSSIFFFNNKLLSSFILLASLFNFYAGLSGLIAVLISVSLAKVMGLDQSKLVGGLYSFNSLLVGIGMGTFFDPSPVFFSLLLLAALLALLLSVTLGGWLGKYGLPFLSIPFVVTFWFIVLPASQFENLGLTQRNIFWMNHVYSIGGNRLLNFLQTINSLPINKLVDTYLRSMSSIFFQDSLIVGSIIALAILISSRIAFSLTVVGFLSAYLFARFTGSAATSITCYNIGANYVMVAIAIGGFFVIPSVYSYLWTVLLVPLTSLVLLSMSKLFGYIQLPVFSLPFSFVVILFLYFLMLRTYPTRLKITPIQYYSPEINLYTFNNNGERLNHFLYFPLYLPFWGEWTVTQGHDGAHTHKGEWGKAFDFMLTDAEGKTFGNEGLSCEDYYSYNKPIVSPADGFVEEIIDNIEDNEIGQVDTINNWGNTIIIRHLYGLYTQISHIKKGSFKVYKGAFVHRGELLASCGNSGRSPEPHIHFQVQTVPVLGAQTIDYPFAYYISKHQKDEQLNQFVKPTELETISGIESNSMLITAFDIQPNAVLKYQYVNEKGSQETVEWIAYTDAYNYKYLYCKASQSYAYYINDGTLFYFTAFYGDKKSLLYYFYLTAYKVPMVYNPNMEVTDVIPLHIVQTRKVEKWLHDFITPFYSYFKILYHVTPTAVDNPFNTESLVLNSRVETSVFGKKTKESESTVMLRNNRVQTFTYQTAKIKIEAQCIS